MHKKKEKPQISYFDIIHLAEACQQQYVDKELNLSQAEYGKVFEDFVEQYKAAEFLSIDYKPVLRVDFPYGIKVTGFKFRELFED